MAADSISLIVLPSGLHINPQYIVAFVDEGSAVKLILMNSHPMWLNGADREEFLDIIKEADDADSNS